MPTAAPSPAEPEPAADDETDEDVTVEGLTVEEVQAVIDELDALHGEAAREAVRAGELTDRFHELHRRAYAGRALARGEGHWQEQADKGFPAFVDEPGDPTSQVVQVLSADEDCVLVLADRDFTPFLRDPAVPEAFRYHVGLEPLGDDDSWVITLDTHYRDGGEPSEEDNPCA